MTACVDVPRRPCLSEVHPPRNCAVDDQVDAVVKDDAGLARNTAALAISCGVAARPVGLRAIAC